MMNQTINMINRVVEVVLVAVFGLMVLSVTWQVISRFLLGDASSFTEELARFCLIWLTVLGAAYVVGKKGHIAMDYLYQKAGEAGKHRMMYLSYGSIILFSLVVLVIGGGNLVFITLKLGQVSSALGLPLGVVYSIVPVSGLMMIAYSIHNWREES